MMCQLVEHGRIKTTLAKAKGLKIWADRTITLGKAGTHVARVRATNQMWASRGDLVRKLFTEIAPRFGDRAGGYTRVLQSGHRQGDAAKMAYIELVGQEGEMRAARPGTAATQPLSVRQILERDPSRAQEVARSIRMPGVAELAEKICRRGMGMRSTSTASGSTNTSRTTSSTTPPTVTTSGDTIGAATTTSTSTSARGYVTRVSDSDHAVYGGERRVSHVRLVRGTGDGDGTPSPVAALVTALRRQSVAG